MSTNIHDSGFRDSRSVSTRGSGSSAGGRRYPAARSAKFSNPPPKYEPRLRVHTPYFGYAVMLTCTAFLLYEFAENGWEVSFERNASVTRW
jgi:hypothetical protein